MKKFISFLLALAMVVSMTALAQAESVYDGSVPVTTEPASLTVLTNSGIGGSYPAPSNDWPFWQYVEKLTGVHIEWEIAASENYGEIISTRLAAGSQLPDIINVGDLATATSAGRNGLMVDMSTLMENNSYYIKNLLADNDFYRQLMVQEDGTMYSICSIVSPIRNQITYLYNKTWLDQVGAEIPTTTDEFVELCRKLQGIDFNGNGKDDEIIFSSAGISMLDSMGTSFGLECYEGSCTTNSGYFTADENGVVTAAVSSEKMKNYYAFLNQLYSEKILDQQIFTANWDTVYEDVAADRVGILFTFSTFAPDFGAVSTMAKDHPYDELFTVGVPLKGPDGYQYMLRRDKAAGDACCITRDCANPELAMRWIDVLYAMPEVQEARYWGEEGLTYTVNENGEKEMLMPEDGSSWMNVRNNVYGGGQIAFAHQQVDSLWLLDYDANPLLQWYVEEDNALAPYFKSFSVPNIPLNPEELDAVDMYSTDIDTYVDEMRAKFVKGEESLDNWDAYVEQLRGMGLDELVAAYQSVYDRSR